MIDISPATDRMAQVLAGLSDDQFDRPTPCPQSSVGDLVDHVGSFTRAFVGVARKETEGSGPPPRPDAANLEAGWRDRIAEDLQTLAEAWAKPDAWEGMTVIGGLDLPAEVAALVVLDELVIHGWDLAVATGQPYEVSAEEIGATKGFVDGFPLPRDGSVFGPVVDVADSAPAWDRLLGLTGRDPAWRS